MSSLTQFFQPPLYWQQFEDLTEGVFKVVFSDPKPTKVGRNGQAQDGVDVVGHEHGNGRLIAIQCKRMDGLDENNNPLPGGAITKTILDAELVKVRKGSWPGLDTWILATTAKRDAKIQKYARILSDKSRTKGSFGIQLWFWDDYVTDLNRNHQLQDWYYKQVIQVRSTTDQDRLIIELIGEAFSRAAFRTPFYLETPADFLEALADTQHAINTGELKDRQTKRLIRREIGGKRAIADKTIASYLRQADKKLQELRVQFQSALATNTIYQSGAMLHIPQGLLNTMTAARDDSIAAVNGALAAAKLSPI